MTEQQNIYQRLNQVRKDVPYLKKDKAVQGYKAVTHDQVTAAVHDSFVENGIIAVPKQRGPGQCVNVGQTSNGTTIIRYEAFYDVDFVNCDEPQDKVTVSVEAHANDHGDKAPGKACSYAVKTAMLKLLSIETGENDESRIEVAEKLKPITDDQVKQIEDKLTETGSDRGKFLRYFSIRDVPDLASGRFDEVMAQLNKKAGNGTAKH